MEARHWVRWTGLAILIALTGCSTRSRVEKILESADGYLARNQTEEALIEYMNVLKLDPAHSRALQQAAKLHFDSGHYPIALPLLTKIKEQNPADVEARMRLAILHRMMQRHREAWDEALVVHNLSPTNTESLVLLASVARTEEQMQEISRRLQNVTRTKEGQSAFQRSTGLIHLRRGQFAEAEAAYVEALKLDPGSEAISLELADLYWLSGQLDKADQAYTKAAEPARKTSYPWLRWVEFRLARNDLKGARAALDQILAAFPDWTPASALLAEVAFEERRHEECQVLIRKVLDQAPDDERTQLLSARLDLARNHTAQALATLDALNTKNNSRDPRVLYHLALAHIQNNQPDLAIHDLLQAVTLNNLYSDAVLLLAKLTLAKREWSTAIARLEPLVAVRTNLTEGLFLLAEAYEGRDSLDQTLQVYQRLESLRPLDPRPPFHRGLLNLRQGNTTQAQAAFQKALSLDSRFTPAILQLIDLDLHQARHPAALARAQQFVQDFPQQAEAHYALARVHWAAKDSVAAERSLTKASELSPENTEAATLLARIYIETGRANQALERVNASLAKNPRDLANLKFKEILSASQGDFAAAIQALERIVQLKPDAVTELNNLAFLYAAQRQDFAKARPFAEKAHQLAPNDPHARDTLGWIVFQQGEFPRARQLLSNASKDLPENAEIQFHGAMAAYQMVLESEARTGFEQALALNPNLAQAQEIRARVAVLNLDVKTNPANAVAVLEAHMARFPKDAVALVRLGAARLEANNIPGARKALEEALALNPEALGTVLPLARFYAHPIGDLAKALDLARKSRELAPEDPGVAAFLGRLTARSGNDSWAASLLGEAAAKLPKDPSIHHELAMTYYRLGRLNDALESLETVGQLQPASQDHLLLLDLVRMAQDPAAYPVERSRIEASLARQSDLLPAQMALALHQSQSSMPDEAIPGLTNILARYPGFPLGQKLLAALYANQPDQLAQAFTLAVSARKLLPTDPALAKTLGKIHYVRSEFPAARTLLEESLRQFPSDPELLFFLGMTQKRLELPEARETLRKAIALNLDPKLAEEARRALAQ